MGGRYVLRQNRVQRSNQLFALIICHFIIWQHLFNKNQSWQPPKKILTVFGRFTLICSSHY